MKSIQQRAEEAAEEIDSWSIPSAATVARIIAGNFSDLEPAQTVRHCEGCDEPADMGEGQTSENGCPGLPAPTASAVERFLGHPLAIEVGVMYRDNQRGYEVRFFFDEVGGDGRELWSSDAEVACQEALDAMGEP